MLLMNLTPCTFIKLMGLKGLTKHHLPLIVYMDGNANKKKNTVTFQFSSMHCEWYYHKIFQICLLLPKYKCRQMYNAGCNCNPFV